MTRSLVLLVEDEPDHAELCRRGMSGRACELEVASDLATARRWLADHTPDLVLCDLRLPDGDPLTLLDLPGLAMIVMTSHGGEERAVDAMRRGALDYVIKSPETFRDLPHIIERGLRTARHVRDKRHAEELLRESDARFRQLASSIQDAFWLYDLASDRVIYASPAWQTLFGIAPDDLLDRPLAARLTSVLERDRPALELLLRERAGREPQRVDYRALGAAGDERLIEERTFPVLDDGKPWRVAGLISDVTQKRALAESVERSQRLGALGQLVGGVSHELNNMLGTIMHATEQLFDRATDGETRELLQLISAAADRNRGLTQQLMAFARVGAHATIAVDINRTTWDAITLLRRTLGARVMVVGDLRASPADIVGDPGQLQTALLNIGIQVRADGGELAYETENVILDEAACATFPFELAPGPYIQISVYSSGTIDVAALRARIFDPFAAADPAVGLGLAAVYGTAVAHRGAVAVYGGLERGTVVRLYLPQARGASPVAEVASPVRGSGHLLVADDEPMVLDALTRTLVSLGYSVTVAHDGQEVLDRLTEGPERYVAIICDLMMPKRHGAALVGEIRKLAPVVPLIVASGFVRDHQLADLATHAVTAFLPKPMRRAELAAVLASALRSSERR